MISIEIKTPKTNAAPDEIEIRLDADGLRAFLSQLEFLKDGRTDHVHLMSESWGGTHLDEQLQNDACTTVKHLKITLR